MNDAEAVTVQCIMSVATSVTGIDKLYCFIFLRNSTVLLKKSNGFQEIHLEFICLVGTKGGFLRKMLAS